jgi:Domain of unknown function (DUF5134)
VNMSGPNWLAAFFAVVMLAVTVYSGGRLIASRLWSRPNRVDIDVVHLVMGLAMAGMFVPALNPLPTRAWEAVFSAVAAWFAWRCMANATGHIAGRPPRPHANSSPHYPTHGVMALAMLYMYFGLPAQPKAGATMMTSGATGMTADFVGLPLLFLVLLLGSGVWELDRAERSRRAALAQPVPRASREPTPAVELIGGPRRERAGWGPVLTVAAAAQPHAADDGPGSDNCLAPGLMTASHVVMCIAMSYMLVVML